VPIDEVASLIDVCFTVCSSLERAGTTVVLTGGSAATFYAPQAYQSRDAGFIITMRGDISESRAIMADLGYMENGGVYSHAANRFTIEFPTGPLAVGQDIIKVWESFQRESERLNVLSRTDCVRDRLASFYFGADRSALGVAVAVARGGDIDHRVIREWSTREGAVAQYEVFVSEMRWRSTGRG
jgi:hypothetical protein